MIRLPALQWWHDSWFPSLGEFTSLVVLMFWGVLALAVALIVLAVAFMVTVFIFKFPAFLEARAEAKQKKWSLKWREKRDREEAGKKSPPIQE